jgi:hypothetical protein
MFTMKLLVSCFAFLIYGASCFAGSVCGTFAGQAVESDEASATTRVITRYRQGEHFHYVYELIFSGNVSPSTRGGSYPVSSVLNGRSSNDVGSSFCTTGGGSMVSEDCQDDHITTNPHTVTPGLFFYAADQDHLNAWDGSLQGTDPHTHERGPVISFHFPQTNFQDLKFE